MEGRQVVEGRFDIDRNMKSGVSGPLKINGRGFDHGIHIYANSEIRIPLNGQYERFEHGSASTTGSVSTALCGSASLVPTGRIGNICGTC